MIIVTGCITLAVWFMAYKALESRRPLPLFAMLTLPVLVALGAMALADRAVSGRSWTQESRLFMILLPMVLAFCGVVWIRMAVTRRLHSKSNSSK